MHAKIFVLHFFATAAAVPGLVAMNGCALETPPQPESVGEASSPLILGSASDWSNSMTVTLYQCDWVGPFVEGTATCPVTDDEMVVGGGIEIEGEGDPGALLGGSYPNSLLQSWSGFTGVPGSGGTPYKLRAYALGLRLGGISGSQLRAMARIKKVFSDHGNRPSAAVWVDEGDWVMVGGGGWASYDQFLTYSYGDLDHWVIGSKDHAYPAEDGYVVVSLIELPTCPPGYVGICLNRYTSWNDGSWVETGYGTNSHWGNQGGFVTTSIGAQASYADAGRMLTDMYPVYFLGGFLAVARSKDYFFSDSGTTWATTANLHQD